MNFLKYGIVGAMALASCVNAVAQAEDDDPMVAYLFAYFTGNAPSQEQVSYAISKDGFNYTPMNGGSPVIDSNKIAFTGCVRDPHILRGHNDGYFYMVCTDMRSNLGWQSNHGLVLLRSTDLINWEHHAIDFQDRYRGTYFADAKYCWAPQTIYDEAAGKYMIYFAFGDNNVCKYQVPHYVYVNEDFSDLEGEPKVLFDTGAAAIDMDIVLNEATGKYHCFYKDEAVTHGITQAIFDKADLLNPDKWNHTGVKISGNVAAEGSGAFQLFDGSWCLMWDCYNNGYYSFNKSDDLITFTEVAKTATKGAFTPRHGTVIQITKSELEALEAAFPYVNSIDNVPTDAPVFIKQKGTDNHIERKTPTDNTAVVRSDSDQPHGESQKVQIIATDTPGYYNLAIESNGVLEYMEQYGNNIWTTVFRTEDADKDFAQWSLEKTSEDDIIKIRNRSTNLFLGTEELTSGAHLYADKNGNEDKHKFYIVYNQDPEDPEDPDDPQGISGVVNDDEAVEYYNVNGVRIDKPTQGVVIVKSGKTATKRIVK